jgi:hypothetical protein
MRKDRLFQFTATGLSLLFIGSIILAIIGGVSGNPVLLACGVTVASVITVGCICVRENNIAGN